MIGLSDITTLAKFAKMVYDRAQKTKELTSLSRRLGERAGRIHGILIQEDFQQQVKDKENPALKAAMDNILKTFRESLPLLGELQKDGIKDKLTHFAKATGNADKLERFIKEVDSAVGDANLALNVGASVKLEQLSYDSQQAHQELSADMAELQRFVTEVMAKDDDTLLDEFEVMKEEIKGELEAAKGKLDRLLKMASKEHAEIPNSVKITVLASGAKADTVEHHTVIGIAMPAMTFPQGTSEADRKALLDIAKASMEATMAAQQEQPDADISIVLLERDAYARVVKDYLEKAQPGKVRMETVGQQPAVSPVQEAPAAEDDGKGKGKEEKKDGEKLEQHGTFSTRSSSSPANEGDSNVPKPEVIPAPGQ